MQANSLQQTGDRRPEEVTVRSGDGSFVVVRHGGRILSLTPRPGLPNLLFPGLASTGVLGGDRLWAAPEVDIFYPDPANRADWRCPAQLDPGSWQLVVDDAVVLSQKAMGASFVRRITALAEPPVPCDLAWSGYRVLDRVHGKQGWSAWHVLVIPAPARIFVSGGTDGVEYYPPVPTTRNGWIEASGKAPRWKVGFSPPADGRLTLAALDPSETGSLVAVLTNTPPDGTYVDVPPAGGPATAAQVYNSAGEGYCELEHHAPLETRSTDCVVLGAWGQMSSRLAFLDALGVGA